MATKKQVDVYMEQETYKALEKLMVEENRKSMSDTVRSVVERWLKTIPKKQ